jgi:site-specific recombinase XerD
MRRAVSDDQAAAFPIAGYRAHVAAWLAWCYAHDVDPQHAVIPDVAQYQRELLGQGLARGAVAYRTVAVRWFYQSLMAAGLRQDNPAAAMGFFHGY